MIVRGRVFVLAGVFAVWAIFIESALVSLQIVEKDGLVARAERQQSRTIQSHSRRGEILDRAGRVLAYSVDADTIYAVPAEIKDGEATASSLCEALDNCSDGLRQVIASRLAENRAFAYVQRQVSPEEARRVFELGLQGIGFLKESRRYYPNKELAAHLLGYVGTDNQGLSGIESTYDDEIRGRPGKILIQTDARQHAYSRVERLPTNGATFELTIDKYLQHIAERELREGIKTHDADSGAVVVLDPLNGEILALASEPTFNPNAFSDSVTGARRNRAIQDLYEPGSTFKVVTASAAIEEQVIDQNEIFDVSAGAIRVGRDWIRDFSIHGQLSFVDVLVVSSNVGAIQIGLRLGPERLSRYVRRFGFGEALSPDFPSESAGIVSNSTSLTDRNVASLSMGYNVAVTPLQMAAAVAAIANGGELIEPRVVRAIHQNGQRAESPMRIIRRVITRDTAAELTTIMEAIVERGTGRRAQVTGYIAAGKTGTAEKLINGIYSDIDHIASFVGFVPSRAPRLVILVMIDTPRAALINGQRQRLYTGGAVAGPVFRRIAESGLRHLAVPSTVNLGTPVTSSESDEVESGQIFVLATENSRIAKNTSGVTTNDGLMPNLHGMSAREALDTVSQLGLSLEFEGDGVVVETDPTVGAVVDRGSVTRAWLSRYPGTPEKFQR